ncbi:MAG: HTH-type transcriptional regulator CysB [Endozoicomonadaceae bacterium]|nr:HTH-type transcriptional regulator CysB [Endozoicomonadaceae bacterium]
MKLQQLRYIWEVVHHNLNVSATAQSLFTSQPGISKQIRLLEDELGVEIFTRNGKHFTQVTPVGEKIVEKAGKILKVVESIKRVSQEFHSHNKGALSLVSTHIYAKYQLPGIINQFAKKYPEVALHLHHGNIEQAVNMVVNNQVDFAIIADNSMYRIHNDIIVIPCYHWEYGIIVPKHHPLADKKILTIEDLIKYPLITYVQNGSGRVHVDDAFEKAGINPHIAFTAADADVIKTYVRLGLGIGIIARMAFDKTADTDLVCLDASPLIASGTVHICIRSGSFLRGFMIDFITMCTNYLTKELVENIIYCNNQEEVNKLLHDLKLPKF